MPLALATRYARALADVVTAPASGVAPGEVREQLRALEDLLAASPELRGVLLSPAVAPARKRAVVSWIAGRLGLPAPLRNFVFVLIDHRRIAGLKEIRQAFEVLMDERTGVVRAEIETAVELTEAQRARLAGELERVAGRRVRGEYSVREEILGGVVARIGSTVYDGSVRGQLAELGRRLKSE